MFLYEAFPPERIIMRLESQNKDEVFEELVDQFCQIEKIKGNVDILEALWERESKMSTGVIRGVAIPHAKTPAVGKISGILGISKRGIDYDAFDSQPVYLVFMLLSPPADSEMYLDLLKRLAGFLENHKFIKELQSQNDPQSINGIIKKYEDSYIATE